MVNKSEEKISTEKFFKKYASCPPTNTNTWYMIQCLQSKLTASLNEGGKSAKIIT